MLFSISINWMNILLIFCEFSENAGYYFNSDGSILTLYDVFITSYLSIFSWGNNWLEASWK
jgi:hypothetical protein